MSNSFGHTFVVTTFGESHGRAVGAVVDGCPAGLALSEADIQPQLDRRRPGQSGLTTARAEKDRVALLAGVENGRTLGGPIAMVVQNQDIRPVDYWDQPAAPRPSHADYTYRLKYGVLASSGGGRASARETLARVAAGAVAEKLLRDRFGVSLAAWVSAVGPVQAPDPDLAGLTRDVVDASPVRCPDAAAAARMVEAIEQAKKERDSVGGMVTCVCRGVPAGWGEPVFDKLHALLAHAMLSIPAARGFDCGAGFASAAMRGSEHNDAFVARPDGGLATATNRSGGIQGGISNGMPVVFRVAFKPAPTIARPQATSDYEGRAVTLETGGRHDPCVVIRAVPVVEAMAALVLADAALRHRPPAPEGNPNA
jgi:chorismate synthase